MCKEVAGGATVCKEVHRARLLFGATVLGQEGNVSGLFFIIMGGALGRGIRKYLGALGADVGLGFPPGWGGCS